MKFTEFMKCNEDSKPYIEERTEILVVDFAEGNCVTRFANGDMQTIPIKELVEDVCCNGLLVLENPRALEYWKGFDAQ